MAITCNTSARTSSPTPSDNSDMYYEGYDGASSPAPSQTANIYGWESDLSPSPMDSETMLMRQAARPSSLALVVEISRDRFPLLPLPPLQRPSPVLRPLRQPKAKGRQKWVRLPFNPFTYL
jgi:hypothetical protein